MTARYWTVTVTPNAGYGSSEADAVALAETLSSLGYSCEVGEFFDDEVSE